MSEYSESLEEIRERLREESLGFFGTVEDDVELDGSPEENIKEYVNKILAKNQAVTGMFSEVFGVQEDSGESDIPEIMISRNFVEWLKEKRNEFANLNSN